MIPILYRSDETLFTSNGVGRLPDCVSCVVTEERNGIYECEFQYPVTGRLYNLIKPGMIIAVTHDNNHDIQPFDIYGYTAPIDGIVTFYARHISYRLSNIILQPFSANSCAEALQRMQTRVYNNNPFTFWTDKDVDGIWTNSVPASIKARLVGESGSILDVYGKGEYEFDKWAVKLHVNRGRDTGIDIRYGVNLSDFEQEINDGASYTAVAPYWRSADGSEVITLPEGYVTADEIPVELMPWTTNTGEYVRDNNGEIIYFNVPTIKPVPLDLSAEFQEKPTIAQLRSLAKSRLNSSSAWLPDENIVVDFVEAPEEYREPKLITKGPSNIVAIYDALPVDAERLIININSSSGATGATLTQRGKNLIPLLIDRLKTLNQSKSWTGNTATEAGMSFEFQTGDAGEVVEIRVSGTYSRQVNVALGTVALKAGMQYIINGVSTAPSWSTFQLYVSANGNKYASVPGTQFTVNADGEYPVYLSTYGAISDAVFYPMIRVASDADATFEPYVSVESAVSFPAEAGTVYGGVLDVTNGKLTVTNPTESAGVYTVDKTNIVMFEGANNIWSNAGDVTVSYYAQNAYEIVNKTVLRPVTLCDRVNVYCGPLNVAATQIQCVRLVYDVLNERNAQLELGTVRPTYSQTLKQSLSGSMVSKAQADALITTALDSATQQITGATNSHVKFVYDDNGGLQEILIMDTDDIETAQKIWRWNSGGLGYSSTGYGGPYGLAMTQDGTIVADFIKAGTISDVEGNNYWNLITGVLNTQVGQIGAFTLNDGALEYINGNKTALIDGDGITFQNQYANSLFKTNVYGQGLQIYDPSKGNHWGMFSTDFYSGQAAKTYTWGIIGYRDSVNLVAYISLFPSGSDEALTDEHVQIRRRALTTYNAYVAGASLYFGGNASDILNNYGRIYYSTSNIMYFMRGAQTHMYFDNSRTVFTPDVYCNNGLTVSGTKSRVVETSDYGNRLLYCYETPTPMFGDIGEGVISESGDCYVWLDPVFAETVESYGYQVFLQPYGRGECYVSERKGAYFVVKGDSGLAFGWEIKAKQSGYDQLRIEREDLRTVGTDGADYGASALEHITTIQKGRILENE